MLATTLTTILRRQGAPGFSPSSLFVSGEKGCWYDPSDFTTLYADTAGTTAITAVEQPVGLMLDKSQGLVLGPELVPDVAAAMGPRNANSTLNSETATSIQVTSAAAGTYGVNAPGVVATTGKTYAITMTMTSSVLRAVSVIMGGAARNITLLAGVPQQYTGFNGPAVVVTAFDIFGSAAGAGETLTVSNISVRELPGNHAVAANNGAARPILRNRYNLLRYSETFNEGTWVKINLNTTGTPAWVNAAIAPDGTQTAEKLIASNTASNTRAIYQGFTPVSGTQYVISFYAKAAEYSKFCISEVGNGRFGATFDLAAQTTASLGGSGFVSSNIVNIGNGWFRCNVVANADVVGWAIAAIGYPTGATLSNAGCSYAGDGTSGIYVWGAQLTTAADHDAINGEYQRIAAAPTVGAAPTYDSDVAKFPPYLYATTDDAMSTASIDFSGGDEMSVFAGVTKESDSALIIVEFSASTNSNTGSFNVVSGTDIFSAGYQSLSRGTAVVAPGQASGVSSLNAPNTAVLSTTHDISGDLSTLRANGISGTNGTSDKGTGNFGNYPLYLFARGGSSLFYTGRLYSLIVRNKLTSGAELTNTESYVAQKTGVTL